MPIRALQDLKIRTRMFTIVILILTGVDCMANLSIHFLDIYFFPNDSENNDYEAKLTYVISETVIFTSFIFFIFASLCYKSKLKLTLISSIYLIFGLLLFCYLLINELKNFGNGGESSVARPLEFYTWHINVIILTLNISSCVLRITGSVFLFLLAANLRRIDEVVQSQLVSECGHSTDVNENILVNESNNSKIKRDLAINISQSCESRESVDRISSTYKNEGVMSPAGSSNIWFVRGSDAEKDERPSHVRANSTHGKFSSDLYYKRILKEEKTIV